MIKFVCDKQIIGDNDEVLFTSGKMYKTKSDKPTLIGIGGFYYEMKDNNGVYRKISNLGENLFSNFRKHGKIYEIYEKIRENHILHAINNHSHNVSKENILSNSNHYDAILKDNTICNVYGFMMVVDGDFERYAYIDEINACISYRDSDNARLIWRMQSLSELKDVCIDIELLSKEKLLNKKFIEEIITPKINVLRGYLDEINSMLEGKNKLKKNKNETI